MDWLDALGVPPQLRPLFLAQRGPAYRDDHPTGDALQAPEDRQWADDHPLGYGLVDAPSPWGYDRAQFDADHPAYAGGAYNPASGFYDAPQETPFAAAGPDGPSLVGAGGAGMGAFASPESSGAMPGAVGGAGGDAQTYASPESSSAMASLPTGGSTDGAPQTDHQDDQAQGGGFDMGAFLDALSQADDGGNQS